MTNETKAAVADFVEVILSLKCDSYYTTIVCFSDDGGADNCYVQVLGSERPCPTMLSGRYSLPEAREILEIVKAALTKGIR